MTAQRTPTRQSPQMVAHNIAFDRLCMNLMARKPSLEGVADEYSNALAIELRSTPLDGELM